MKTIGVDVGGTFTDLVYCDLATGRHAIHKVPTTPDDPSVAVVQGIAELRARRGISAGEAEHVLHGTTTATNAVLENRGARTGMVTNEGLRDLIHIARHQRVEHYSIMQELPWQSRPLVPRRHRKVVKGRLLAPRGAQRSWHRDAFDFLLAPARGWRIASFPLPMVRCVMPTPR